MNKFKTVIHFNIFLFLLFSHVVTAQSDPGTLSTASYERLEYDLGDIFQPSPFPPEYIVEVKASVHTPSAPGTYPLVIMLHGRHSTCYTSSTSAGYIKYPCRDDSNEIPNYAGYDYIGELLASRGYIMVSISSNGIIGASVPDFSTSEKAASHYEADLNELMVARAELIDHHLDLWNTWNTSNSGPFGDAFVGKVDMNNIITIGHSRGGEGVVKHYEYNQTQTPSYNINGVFAIAPTAFNRLSDGAMNFGLMVGDCDGDVANLQGLFYYDDSRYQLLNSDGGTYHNFILKGANHNFFNTVWTPGEYTGGGTSDDWAIRNSDQSDSYCGISNSENERLSDEQQRNVLKAYISAFVEKYAGNKDTYDDILTGIADAPPSATIDPDVLHPSYHPPVSKRKDINRMTEDSNTQVNTVGGNVTTSGLSFFESCGYDDGACAQEYIRENHYRTHAFVNTSSSLGRISVEWTSPGGWYRNTIPAGQSNVSAYSHITLRAAVNSNDSINLNGTSPQNFTVELTDGAGNTDIVEVADYSDALYVGRGTQKWYLPRSLSHTIAIPLTTFSNLDLNNITDLRFIFNKSDEGSLLISDIAFTRFTAPPEYCDAQGTTHFEFIESVELNGQSNVSGDNNGYADFTGTILTTLGNTNTIELTSGFPDDSPHSDVQWAVWIDFNKDGDFDDADEEVFLGNSSMAQPTLTGTFTAIPGTGTTRMRVVMRWALALSSCGNLSHGEVEDYTVQLTDVSACTQGSACDDNDSCTLGDVYNENCLCVGTLVDSDADGICDYEDDDACSITAVLDSPDYDYESGDNIDIRTSNSIFASNQIYANADVTYDAGFTISLTDGFHAHEGSIFHAFIEGCSNGDVNDKQSIEDSSLTIRNYPNPFTGQTTIEFVLKQDTPVTLFVSDVTGKQIAVLLNNDEKTQGTHAVTFNGNNYPAGMYYYTIQAGEYYGTQKMILAK